MRSSTDMPDPPATRTWRAAVPAPLPRASSRLSLGSLCFVLFLSVMLIGSNALQGSDPESGIGQGDAFNQVAYVGIFLTLVAAAAMRNARLLLCVPTGITLLIGYGFLSTLWAIAPFISFRRMTLTAMVLWIVFRTVADLGPDRVLKLLRYVLLAVMIGNYAVRLFTPYGVHVDSMEEEFSVIGSWRGIITHKNLTGAVCAMTILLFTFDNRDFPKIVSLLVVIASAVFLYFTNSKTSQGVLLVALAIGALVRPYNANYRTFLAVVVGIVATLAVLVISDRSADLAAIFNDPTALTGRAAIWPLLLDYAADHPWTGAGFGSFWRIGDDSPIWALTSGWVATYAPHGHNGYLDLLVTIGLPGLLLAVVTLLLWPLARLMFSLTITKPRRSLLLAIMVFGIGGNMTESTLLNAATPVQVFLSIAIAIIYHESRRSPGVHQRFRRRLRSLSGLRGMPAGA